MKRKKFKFLSIIALMTAVIYSFSGCSLYISSIDKLLRPPMSDVDLEKAIKDEFGSDITLFSPQSFSTDDGIDYLSSIYNYCDIDSDGFDEVITFITDGTSSEDMYMVVLEKQDDKWSIVSKVNGIGNGVNSLVVENLSDFTDEKQIVTTWKYVDKNVLSIHSLEENSQGKNLKQLCKNYQYDDYKMCDVDNDGKKEFLILNYSDSTVSEDISPKVYVLKMSAGGTVEPIGTAELAQNVIDASYLISDSFDAVSFVVYFDVFDTTGNYYSNVIYWDNKLSALVKYSEGNKITLNENSTTKIERFVTERKAGIKCSDINSDNIPEIPLRKEFSYSEKGKNDLGLTLWSQIAFTEEGNCEFIVNDDDFRIYFDANNYFKLPSWVDNSSVYAKYNQDRRTWSVMYSPGGFSQGERVEDYLVATVYEIEDGYIEKYVNQGYTLLGSSTVTTGHSIVCLLTKYGYSYGFRENDFINIK